MTNLALFSLWLTRPLYLQIPTRFYFGNDLRQISSSSEKLCSSYTLLWSLVLLLQTWRGAHITESCPIFSNISIISKNMYQPYQKALPWLLPLSASSLLSLLYLGPGHFWAWWWVRAGQKRKKPCDLAPSWSTCYPRARVKWWNKSQLPDPGTP